MIAKSDLFILTISSGLLIFTLMRTSLDTDTRYSGAVRPATKDVPQVIGMQNTSAPNTANSNLSDQATAQVVLPVESIPVSTVVAAPIEFEEPEVIREAAFKTHTVKSGEYLGLLAKRYNTTVDELRSLNNLTGSTIFIGQKLVYPGI